MKRSKFFLYFTIIALFVMIHTRGYSLSGPLSTQGSQIVTEEGVPVRLQGVSWFGFETNSFAPQGLDVRSYRSMMDQMKSLGFNTLRIPFSNQMFDEGNAPTGIDYKINPDLEGLTSIQILDKIIEYANAIDMGVILDHHRSEAGEGDVETGLWYTEKYPQKRFVEDWQKLADRYKDETAIIGADLHNEPHGDATWGSGDEATDWKSAAEMTGNAILTINPQWLIIVQGIETYQEEKYWRGGNLMGVKNAQVLLETPEKLVYSAHDYPKSIFNQPWFDNPNYPYNLPETFRNAWGYLVETDMAPVLLGQFGSKFKDPEDEAWMETLSGYLNGDVAATGQSELKEDKKGVSWIWWAWNPNNGDSGGILQDDWQTVDEAKLPFLKKIMTEEQNPHHNG